MIHSRRHRPAWRSHKRFPIPQLCSKSILIRSENRTYPRDFQQQHAAEYLVTFLCDVELRREHQPFFHKISSVFAALKAAVAVGGDPERVCAPFEIMFHQSKSWSEHFLLSGKQGFLIKWPRGVGGSWDSARIFNIWPNSFVDTTPIPKRIWEAADPPADTVAQSPFPISIPVLFSSVPLSPETKKLQGTGVELSAYEMWQPFKTFIFHQLST